MILKRDENNLLEINQYIKKNLPNGGIILLRGPLASGKTTLVKSFAKFLGIKDDVTSPTFSIMQNYEDKIFHYDIYNKGLNEFLSLGLLENLSLDGYHFIEWADKNFEKIIKELLFDYIIIEIKIDKESRVYTLKKAIDES